MRGNVSKEAGINHSINHCSAIAMTFKSQWNAVERKDEVPG